MDKSKCNHWKNTHDVIKWFGDIHNKKSHTFIAFDICDFYPYINEELLDKALDFASHYIEKSGLMKGELSSTQKRSLSITITWNGTQ